MADESPYDVVVTETLTGRVVSRPPVSALNFGWTHLGVGTASITPRRFHKALNMADFDAPARSIWILRYGTPIWGGLIWKPELDTDEGVKIDAEEFHSYLQHRNIRSKASMTYVDSGTAHPRWDGVDQFRILKDVVDHIQSFTNGDIRLNVDWATLSGQERNYAIELTSAIKADRVLMDLLEKQNGFEFLQRVEFGTGNELIATLQLFYPMSGIDNPTALRYPGNCTKVKFSIDGKVRTNGAQIYGRANHRAYYANPPDGMPLIEDDIMRARLSESSDLITAGKRVITRRKNRGVQITVTLAAEWVDRGLKTFGIGDRVHVHIDDPDYQTAAVKRIVDMRVTVDEEKETLEISLEDPEAEEA